MQTKKYFIALWITSKNKILAVDTEFGSMVDFSYIFKYNKQTLQKKLTFAVISNKPSKHEYKCPSLISAQYNAKLH